MEGLEAKLKDVAGALERFALVGGDTEKLAKLARDLREIEEGIDGWPHFALREVAHAAADVRGYDSRDAGVYERGWLDGYFHGSTQQLSALRRKGS